MSMTRSPEHVRAQTRLDGEDFIREFACHIQQNVRLSMNQAMNIAADHLAQAQAKAESIGRDRAQEPDPDEPVDH